MSHRALAVGLGVAVAALILGIALWPSGGPASRCEDAGGQILVGPGGETSCIDGRTFLPLESFEKQENRR